MKQISVDRQHRDTQRWFGHQARGFTLVELMVTVAVAAIVTAAAASSFSAAAERKALVRAAEAAEAELQLTRLEALKRNTALAVSWYGGEFWCYGIDTGTCDCKTASDCSIKEVAGSSIVRGIFLNSVSFSGASSVLFDHIRGTASSAGQVDFQTPSGLDLRVELTASGLTRICSPSNGVMGYPSC
jgi:prepilin-type N-terminal cleavage/methylation domain-containing protein